MHFGFGGVLIGSKWLLAAKELHRGVPLLPAPKSNQGFRNPIGFNDFGLHIIIIHPQALGSPNGQIYHFESNKNVLYIQALKSVFGMLFFQSHCCQPNNVYFLQAVIIHECKHDYYCSCTTVSPCLLLCDLQFKKCLKVFRLNSTILSIKTASPQAA